MTIEKQNQINADCCRSLAERLLLRSLDIAFGLYTPLKTMWVVMARRQIIREYRKRHQLSEADFLEKAWKTDTREGVNGE